MVPVIYVGSYDVIASHSGVVANRPESITVPVIPVIGRGNMLRLSADHVIGRRRGVVRILLLHIDPRVIVVRDLVPKEQTFPAPMVECSDRIRSHQGSSNGISVYLHPHRGIDTFSLIPMCIKPGKEPADTV